MKTYQRLKAPIFLFYTEITENHLQHCEKYQAGDKLYRSAHDSTGKVLRITKSMHGSAIGLIRHLQRINKEMHRLYLHLDTLQKQGQKPSPEEIKVAGGTLPFNVLGYNLDSKGSIIPNEIVSGPMGPIKADVSHSLFVLSDSQRLTSLTQQEPFSQETWTRLVSEWVAACDQPFDAVEQPEFKRLIEYTTRCNTTIKIPSSSTVKDSIMTMGDETVEDLKTLITVGDTLFSLSTQLICCLLTEY